jgi:hypothetical protein
MKTSDHPARVPPALRQPPLTAEGETPPETQPVYRPQPETIPESAAEAERRAAPALDAADEIDAELETANAYWDSIETAPRDGTDIAVRYDEADQDGRPVKWKHGRRFDRRRWVDGGRWVSNDLAPLPASEPVQWLRPAKQEQPEVDAQAEAAE